MHEMNKKTRCESFIYYRFLQTQIIAEALRVVGAIVKIIRPLSADEDSMVDDFAYQPLVQPLYNAIYPRLSAHDIDQVRLVL